MTNIPKLPDDDATLKLLDQKPGKVFEIGDQPIGKIFFTPDVFGDVLEYFKKEYPDIIGTTPQWPRFDRMKVAYEGLNTGFTRIGISMQGNDLVGTIVDLTSLVSLTMGMAVVLGVDIRPLWVAAHKARMEGKEVNIGLLLDLQNPLQNPDRE